MDSPFDAESVYSSIELTFVYSEVHRCFNTLVKPPILNLQQSIPYGSEMIPAAGVQFVISDKKNMAPCAIPT
eukprot:8027843-Karenia_brevis.AAC.1